MDRSADSSGVSKLLIAITLSVAVGGAAFLAWRRAAPLSRWYRRTRRRRDERTQRGPNPQRTPGTDPI
ncbi:hypothetical protein [Natrinema sp. 74]|uniref:hypothetical protein n=1 Tax=Natrinema sp. 74 TaxID=3384159 RepID=UPI0038D3C0AE